MSVLRWSLDYEKQQYYISEKDYADLLERYRKIYYENLERYEGYSRGSKNELLRILNDNPNFFGIWLPYSLIGHSEKAKHIIDTTTVQRNYPIGSVDLNRNHSSDVLV